MAKRKIPKLNYWLSLLVLTFASMLKAKLVFADQFSWCFQKPVSSYCLDNYDDPTNRKYKTPMDLKVAYDAFLAKQYLDYIETSDLSFLTSKTWNIHILMVNKISGRVLTDVNQVLYRWGDNCDASDVYDPATGECESPNNVSLRKDRGAVAPLSCPTFSPVGESGNNFQSMQDYVNPGSSNLEFFRYYNSNDASTSTSYSSALTLDTDSVAVTFDDGRQALFTRVGDILTPESTEMGSLIKTNDTWTYSSPGNQVSMFDAGGRLSRIRNTRGQTQTLTYSGASTTVTDDTGHQLIFTKNDLQQISRLSTPQSLITYTYNANALLTSSTKIEGGVTSIQTYAYENAKNPKLLTGITDERDVRISTWTYDDLGRLTSSIGAAGANKNTFTYADDGSMTVINEFGKQTTYRYQISQGLKLITAIQGEPSSNCPASNSSYTYNDRGQVLTKTDAKGFITAYTYNDRGLENSRTEASGTSLARTTTTMWDPSRFLRTQVVEPTRTTVYSYDSQGRLVSQVTTPH